MRETEDYHKLVMNNNTGLPSGHKVILRKMIKVKASTALRKVKTASKKIAKTPTVAVGILAVAIFAVGFASVVFYQKFRHG
jgi:hypothetical protein